MSISRLRFYLHKKVSLKNSRRQAQSGRRSIQPIRSNLKLAARLLKSYRSKLSVTLITGQNITVSLDTEIRAKNGEDVIFNCHAAGDPQPSYTWTHNGQVVTNSNHYTGTIYPLLINYES